MHKGVLILGLVCFCATGASAQNKVDNGWACGKPAPANSIDVGDQPNHAYAIDQIKCTSTKGEIGGVREKEGLGTEFGEIKGNRSSGHAIFVETMENGDKLYASYQPTIMLKDGQMQSGSDKWEYTGGTGKFKGLKGSGTCKGTGNADGSSTWTCTGTYTLP
jgi:hypothetical protein